MSYREIHDDLSISTTLGRVSDLAFRLYILMLSQTDQWGRLPGDHTKIRARCIPTRPVTDQQLHDAISELVAVERVDIYDEAGTRVCQLVNFDERQHVANLKRSPSRYPARTAASTSPYDLALSLPLSGHGPEACDLGLSNAD